jgi:beta-barrel assembly-enhancing protease
MRETTPRNCLGRSHGRIVGSVALLALAGCATPGARSAELGLANALISSDQENQIGLQVKTELEQKEKVKYLADPQVVDYVRTVAGRVIDRGQKDRPDVKWQVNVIDDPKTVNAFATPGGYLYVYSGLLAAADDEAQLAGVMAHETGHVVARHSARNMITAYGLEAVASLAGGQNPGLLTQVATTIAGNGLMLKHSRLDETEADELGARYASAAGYDPNSLIAFFQTLQSKEGAMPGVMVFLSDHPATGDRIQHLQQFIAANHLTGSNRGQAQFGPIKARVLATASRPASAGAPPPPPPPGAAPPPPPGAAAAAPGAPPPPPPPPPR